MYKSGLKRELLQNVGRMYFMLPLLPILPALLYPLFLFRYSLTRDLMMSY